MNIYLIPGLGGDKRMYASQLRRYPNTKVLEFFRPKLNESLKSYAKRLAEGIDASEPFILLGVSLGGIMAIEISKFIKPEKIISISSVQTRKQIPFYMRWFKFFPLQKFIPGKFYMWMFFLLLRFKKGFQKTNHIIETLRNMAMDTDSRFVYWAVHRVVNWQNMKVSNNLISVHGDADLLFPIGDRKIDYVVEGGGHPMLLTHAVAVNKILDEILGITKQEREN
jgi:pimeloyl-ACP methyl ester carboxylesterase